MADHIRFQQAVESLRIRNFRLFLIGNTVSNLGEWAQRIGQAWLVLELTGSAVLLGVSAALQAAPMVIIGPWAGLVADRRNKLDLLRITQSLSAVVAVTLAILTYLGTIDVVGVLALALALGTVKAFDFPIKQGLVIELVGTRNLVNAVTLNNIGFNAAKSIGPALAGFIIAIYGIAPSFMLNAVSYLGLLTAIAMMDRGSIEFPTRVERGPKQLRAGFRHVLESPVLAATMLLMMIVGLLAFEWQVLLPIFAREVFDGDASTFGAMFTAMGVGSIAGGLLLAGRLRTDASALLLAGVSFAVLFAMHALATTLGQAFVLLLMLGAASTALRSIGQSVLLGHSRPDMRGRVSALLSVAFLGTTLVGGPLIGFLTQLLGVRWTFVAVGSCVLAAALGTYPTLRAHIGGQRAPAP